MAQKGAIPIVVILIVILASAVAAGSLVYRQQTNRLTDTLLHLGQPEGSNAGTVQPHPATPAAMPTGGTGKQMDACPPGLVQYGVPLGCVKPETIQYCKTHPCPK